MKAYSVHREVKPGLPVVRATLKNGAQIAAVELGRSQYGYPTLVSVGNPPMVPCPRIGAYNAKESTWWCSDEAEKPMPGEFVCPECGVKYTPWVKTTWDNHPGLHLDNPRVRGFGWSCEHPKAGQVYGRLFEVRLGQSQSGKPKLIGCQSDKDEAVLVRTDTDGGYKRNNYGGATVVAGEPKFIARASVATSSSYRLGNYSEGLVVMKPGDVIKMTFSDGETALALFFKDGQLTVCPFGQWQAGQAGESVQKGADSAETLYSSMAAYTFAPGGLSVGIQTQTLGSGGHGLILGPRGGSWRIRERVTLAAVNLPEVITHAGVTKSGKSLVLVASDQVESGKYLVRVDTDGLRKGGYTGAVAFRGNPVLLAEGYMEIGTQNVQHHRDQLWVLAAGDVLRVGQTYEEYYSSDHATYIKEGVVVTEKFRDWALREARRDPAPFIAAGWCPMDRLPAEWMGKVIEVCDAVRDDYLHAPFILESVKPVTIVGGWDSFKESDRFRVAINTSMVWAKLRLDLTPEAPKNVTKVEETIEFGDPPFASGTRKYARIKTVIEHHEASFGYPARDETFFVIAVDGAVAEKFQITVYEHSGQRHEAKESLGQVEMTWTLRDAFGKYRRLRLPEGHNEQLNGAFAIEFVQPRRGSWYMNLLTPEMLEKEKEQILAEVKANLPLRHWAKAIPNKPGAFGMPVGEDGWTPCEPDKASKWVMYERERKWPDSHPDAFVMVPMKGFRSKSTGVTFAALVADYTRP